MMESLVRVMSRSSNATSRPVLHQQRELAPSTASFGSERLNPVDPSNRLRQKERISPERFGPACPTLSRRRLGWHAGRELC